MNIHGLFPHLSRACEIAMLGGQSIRLIAGVNGSDIPFPEEDMAAIAEEIKNKADIKISTGVADMDVELVLPDAETILQYAVDGKKSETWDDITDRTMEAGDNAIPEKKLNRAGRALLKTAVDRLGFSVSTVERVMFVAQTIACLAGSKDILPEHIAEAIHYKSAGK